ncbi:MAG: phosphate ABC transporter ATP-binding protein [Alicyclobacillus sp.]|nr:phosphate ABC transporter ATP-binding protein [Alicyclobacillus sp.]
MTHSAREHPWALQFVNVSKWVVGEQGRRCVLDRLNGRVATGTLLTLVGPSGAGKSTLLSLCNLLQTPDDGEVWVLGREVRDWPVSQLRRKVGLVWQQPVMLPGTVADNLALAARLHHEPPADGAALLCRVGLPADLLHRPAHELSGGQMQRVALARTLANQPDILLLDEVTSALDREAADVIEKLIVEWVNSEHKTAVWVTHDTEQARRVGHETWLIAEGRAVEQAPTAQFFTAPQTVWGQRWVLAGQSQGERNA